MITRANKKRIMAQLSTVIDSHELTKPKRLHVVPQRGISSSRIKKNEEEKVKPS